MNDEKLISLVDRRKKLEPLAEAEQTARIKRILDEIYGVLNAHDCNAFDVGILAAALFVHHVDSRSGIRGDLDGKFERWHATMGFLCSLGEIVRIWQAEGNYEGRLPPWEDWEQWVKNCEEADRD
jgi:hypothetical protein